MAQQMHDKHVADGQQQKDKIIAEAQIEASSLVNDAQEKSRKILGALEQQRSVLERKVEQLRGFERDYRSRLKAYIEGQLRDLDARGSVAAPEVGEASYGRLSKYSESRWLRIPRPPAFAINRHRAACSRPADAKQQTPSPALAPERKPYD